jgi:hypothetical protein
MGAHLGRQMLGATWKRHRVLGCMADHAAQLAQIAVPRIQQQALERTDRPRLRPGVAVVLAEEQLGPAQDVLAPFAQRRQLQRRVGLPEQRQQIAAKLAPPHGFVEINVGRRDHARVAVAPATIR